MENLCQLLCECFGFVDSLRDVKRNPDADADHVDLTADEQRSYHVFLSHPDADADHVDLTADEQRSYHVFLSHRGPDLKHTVVDVLCKFLESKDLTYFVDYQMPEGRKFPPLLTQAIRNSQVHILFLTPRFAESSWCLEEAAQIMELQRVPRPAGTTSMPPYHVLPTFYGVQPSHVRHPRPGSKYDVSILHMRHYTKEQRFQGGMTEEICSRVVEFLSGSLQPCIGDFKWLEEIYSIQLEQAEKALLSNPDKTVSIGIFGPHRSEFAKVLFSKFRKSFSASCILLNVKEQAKSREGLLKLQSTLLWELANSRSDFSNSGMGMALLLDRLKNINCLIVIDDIDDDEEQLKNLLVHDCKHHLGRGSRLVVTSVYPHVLYKRAQTDEAINLRTDDQRGDEPAESRKRLAICCKSKSVHRGFVDHLHESFSMLGLSVFLVGGADLLNAAFKKQANLILVILSPRFNLDFPDVVRRLQEAFTSCPDVKLVYVFYGSQSGRSVSDLLLTSPPSVIVVDPAFRQSLSKDAFNFSVNFETPSEFNGGDFKTLVHTIVLDHMQHEFKMSVADFPVGLIKRQQKLEDLIYGRISEGKVLGPIGILGMGGIGKTTIAMSLYNRMHRKFEGSVFLLNVRAQANQSGLVLLQKAIFDNVLGKGTDQAVRFSDVSTGGALLEKRLCGTHTLIILDDVDHISQLDALLKPLNLAPGSAVIITSRNRRILEAAGVGDGIYEVGLLEEEGARKLFYWHAFLKPFPPPHLRDVARKLIKACGGLPLSLKIIGAHIFNCDDPVYWEETLYHIKEANNEIFELLSVTVDALEGYQKVAFLDVCCFLIGKPYQTAQRVWSGCRWKGHPWNVATCLKVLKSKCIITVDATDDTIGMHDQIRDMGRYIVDNTTEEKSSQQKEPPKYIWNAMNAIAIPQDKLGIDKLWGFAWMSKTMAICDADAMQRLSRLQFLILDNVQMEGESRNLWLQWRQSQFTVLPPALCNSRSLRVLDFSESTWLEALWRDSTAEQVPKSLQELNLSGCKNLKDLPQFDLFLRDLQWFSLNGCKRIDYLHCSIGSLTKLIYLDVSDCTSLRSLPDSIQDGCSLKQLRLSGCSLLQSLPEGIGRCFELSEVCLDQTGLSTLPESLGDLKRLEKLSLESCQNLACLPPSIGGLELLRVCNLSECPKLQQLPDRFCELTNLEELNLWRCDLQDLP
ncbi:hypothetical protein L7F22_044558 [Adiantum nelumboides]|nr:hypothetical protein [Adiantum nelumboides]